MKKYAQLIDNKTKLCNVGVGSNTDFYKSIGMELLDVEQAYDGNWYLKGYAPSQPLEELKAEKLEALTAYAGQFDQYKCDDMYVTSSIGGYKFNADIRSQTNMQGLIDVLADDATTLYKDYDNEFRTMTKADLAVLKSECLQNGQYLYQQKWAYGAQINACTTKEELEVITFDFKMKDFNE